MEESARAAVLAWIAYMEADGAFPDPEYDQFHLAMEALAEEIGLGDRLLVARGKD